MQDLVARAFEQIPAGLALVDRSGRVLAWNHRLRTWLGREQESLEGQSVPKLVDLLGPLAGESPSGPRQNLNQGPWPRVFETQLQTLDEEPRWLSWQVQPLEGQEDTLLVLVLDVTERKRDEERLVEAHRAARQASEAKSQFLANMTHEIRTPIHTIIGMTELLTQTELSVEQRDYLKQITTAADTLINLVDDVLDFSKIEAGRMVLERVAFRLDEVISQAVSLVAARAYARGLDLAVDLDHSCFEPLLGDPVRVRQILVNLLTNAVKFTPRGHIVVRAWREETDGATFLEVEDSGIGISPEAFEHIFVPFSQADYSHTRKYGGTGLGLAISRQLARMMGGDIQVRSHPGRGSTFTVRLLLERSGEGADPEVWANLFRGKRVLVLEPQDQSRSSLVRMLSSLGCEVGQCLSGKELLLNVAGGEGWDVVVLSDMVRDYDPWRLEETIRSLPARPTRILLATTPLTSLEIARRRGQRSFHGYLVKPYLSTAVARELFRALSGQPESFTASEVVDPRGQVSALRGWRVLVAEDHEVNRALFQLILERMGAEVLLASNGKEALQVFEREHPQLVFLDLQMPELDGFEAARLMHQRDPSVPLIGVSASALKSEIEKARAAGMVDFLPKPFKRGDVEEVLGRLDLDQRRPTTDDTRLAPEAASSAIFDTREALEAFLDNREVLERVVLNFLGKGEEDLQQLRLALDRQDVEAAFRLAHALKGSSRNLCARRLGEAAAALEAEARRSSDTSSLEPLFMNLVHEWQAFRLEAERWLGPGQSG